MIDSSCYGERSNEVIGELIDDIKSLLKKHGSLLNELSIKNPIKDNIRIDAALSIVGMDCILSINKRELIRLSKNVG